MAKKTVSVAGVQAKAKAVQGQVVKQVVDGKRRAEQEMKNVRKQLESTYKKVEGYAKKNPEKVALASAAVGAALAVAVSMFIGGDKKTGGRGKK